ncbi:hypothetical protein C8R45DRAFT_1115617 [Mycena sanguinolenta]|nr:hypothetical protein C8R45DRAFT_1115617 [Mycena sanguinolenta]
MHWVSCPSRHAASSYSWNVEAAEADVASARPRHALDIPSAEISAILVLGSPAPPGDRHRRRRCGRGCEARRRPIRTWWGDVVFAVPELSCRERRRPIQPSIPSTRCLGCTSRPKRNAEVYIVDLGHRRRVSMKCMPSRRAQPLIEVRDVVECIAGLTAEHVIHEQGAFIPPTRAPSAHPTLPVHTVPPALRPLVYRAAQC